MGDTVTIELTGDQARQLIELLVNLETASGTGGQWAEESVLRTIRKRVSEALGQ